LPAGAVSDENPLLISSDPMREEFKEVPVQALEWGMYISKLDRPWTETPFMFQGFTLKTEQQLSALKKYCKKVYVDPEKYQPVDPPKLAAPASPAADTRKNAAIQSQLNERIRGPAIYQTRVTVEQEMARASSAYQRSTAIVRRFSEVVRSGKVLDGARTKEVVREITESVERNPDAMMLLTKLSEKSKETLNRSVEISVYMTAFGRFLQLPRDKLELLSMLGLLQDSGMLRLPTGLPERRSQLTVAEDEVFRTHIEHTVEILSKTPGLPAELPALAAMHHERYDGSGYPRGLKANAIPLIGQIAALVDAFDMLIAPHPYGQALSPSAALNVLYQNRGDKFHAGAVEQFIQCLGAFPVGAAVELNSGEIGIVIAQNMVRRLQPRVMVVQDANGNPIIPHKILDLMNEPRVTPDEVYRIRRTLEAGSVKVDPKELFL
jgi:HD-GYP domain-containing protein (c-di-GMP phosphodiesterase class II)